MEKVIDMFNRKGEIILSDSENYSSIKANMYFYCTPFLRNIPDGALTLRQFSPSAKLYKEYLENLECGLSSKYAKEYKGKFLKELKERYDYTIIIDKLRYMVDMGMIIVIFMDYQFLYCNANVLIDELVSYGLRVKTMY